MSLSRLLQLNNQGVSLLSSSNVNEARHLFQEGLKGLRGSLEPCTNTVNTDRGDNCEQRLEVIPVETTDFATLSTSTGTPNGFLMYNKPVILMFKQEHSKSNTSCNDRYTTVQEYQLAAASIMYNAALALHLEGVSLPNEKAAQPIFRALALYQSANNLISSFGLCHHDENAWLSIAIVNNMAHIYAKGGQVDGVMHEDFVKCCNWLRQHLSLYYTFVQDALFFELNTTIELGATPCRRKL